MMTDQDLGPEWLCYKLYCGVWNADTLLSGPVIMITSHFEKKGWVNEWFFIRHSDTGFHIRLYLKITESKWHAYVIRTFHSGLKPYQRTGFVQKIMTDNYQPEYHRYGSDTMVLAERIFHQDSIAFLGFLDQTAGDEREILRLQYAILSIDTLLEAFELKINQKCELLKSLNGAFETAFKSNSDQRKYLTKLFRAHKNEIYISLSVQQSGDKSYLLYLVLRQRTEGIVPVVKQLRELDQAGKLQVSIMRLLKNYIHLLINRVIPDQAYLHEMVIYDFLYQYYRNANERKNGSGRIDYVNSSIKTVLV